MLSIYLEVKHKMLVQSEPNLGSNPPITWSPLPPLIPPAMLNPEKLCGWRSDGWWQRGVCSSYNGRLAELITGDHTWSAADDHLSSLSKGSEAKISPPIVARRAPASLCKQYVIKRVLLHPLLGCIILQLHNRTYDVSVHCQEETGQRVYGHSLSITRGVLILWCDNRWRWHQSVFRQVLAKTFNLWFQSGALPMFSARGCVPDISPRNTVPGEVFPNALPREQRVYWKILSL